MKIVLALILLCLVGCSGNPVRLRVKNCSPVGNQSSGLWDCDAPADIYRHARKE